MRGKRLSLSACSMQAPLARTTHCSGVSNLAGALHPLWGVKKAGNSSLPFTATQTPWGKACKTAVCLILTWPCRRGNTCSIQTCSSQMADCCSLPHSIPGSPGTQVCEVCPAPASTENEEVGCADVPKWSLYKCVVVFSVSSLTLIRMVGSCRQLTDLAPAQTTVTGVLLSSVRSAEISMVCSAPLV